MLCRLSRCSCTLTSYYDCHLQHYSNLYIGGLRVEASGRMHITPHSGLRLDEQNNIAFSILHQMKYKRHLSKHYYSGLQSDPKKGKTQIEN